MTRRIAILPDAVAEPDRRRRGGGAPRLGGEGAGGEPIDAGARHVRVELEHGREDADLVSDDGSGMSREDAVLALDRHATSKITSAADLVGVAHLRLPRRGAAGDRLGIPLHPLTSRRRRRHRDERHRRAGGRAWRAVAGSGAPRSRCGRSSSIRRRAGNSSAPLPSETRAAIEAVRHARAGASAVGFELSMRRRHPAPGAGGPG